MGGIASRMGEREVSLESIVQRRPPGAQIGKYFFGTVQFHGASAVI